MTSRRRQFLIAQQTRLDEELNAVEHDLSSSPREVDRVRLYRDAYRILAEIEIIEAQLSELDSQSSNPNVRDRNLEMSLRKLDFVKAKKVGISIREKLNEEGGSVLFLLQKSKKQMGRYCVEEVLREIMTDQIVCGEILAYKRYPIGLDSKFLPCDEIGFLTGLAGYLKITEGSDSITLCKRIRESICASMREGVTICLEIGSLDKLLKKEDFLKWFLLEFWQPLIDEIIVDCRKYGSKLIVVLIANIRILPDCQSTYFCDIDNFDCYKILELPLPNWTADDIYIWLIRFRSLSFQMIERSNDELLEVAERIYEESDGTPESVCLSLREEFLGKKFL